MSSPNPSAVAFLSRAIDVVGVTITLQRNSGVAPNVVSFQATIPALVKNATPDTTQEAQAGLPASQMGAISQDDRIVVVRVDDLVNARYPLPIQKGDWLILSESTDNLTITKVDPYKRATQNAIEFTASGVQ